MGSVHRKISFDLLQIKFHLNASSNAIKSNISSTSAQQAFPVQEVTPPARGRSLHVKVVLERSPTTGESMQKRYLPRSLQHTQIASATTFVKRTVAAAATRYETSAASPRESIQPTLWTLVMSITAVFCASTFTGMMADEVWWLGWDYIHLNFVDLHGLFLCNGLKNAANWVKKTSWTG